MTIELKQKGVNMLQGHSGGDRLEKDEIMLTLGSVFLPMLFGGRRHHGISPDGTATPGFLAGTLNLLVKIWEEKGGSMKDESEMLESMFADPTAKDVKLTPLERNKVAAVLKGMTPAERNVFRIAIFIMNPEVATIETAGKTDKDGKASPATKRTERTGIDPRASVLRGISEMVADDLSNVADVRDILRNAGTLGSDNASLHLLSKIQEGLKAALCGMLGINTIENITVSLLRQKGQELISHMEVPNPALPKPDDKAGWFVRAMRVITPGAFPNK